MHLLIAFHAGIVLLYLGILIKAAKDDLLWRADFTNLYTGGTIIRQGLGSHLYDLSIQTNIQQAILGSGKMFMDGVLPFNNPPYVALVMAPFSLLPLDCAFWCWTALQMGFFQIILWRGSALLSAWSPTERWALVSALGAFFPLFVHFLFGSLSLLVFLCLVEWYLALKKGKEFVAGVWLALATAKFQMILFPALVVLAGRRRQALAGAGAAILLTIAVTTALLGPFIWSDYFRWLVATSGYFDRFGVYPEAMPNLKGTLTILWGSKHAAIIQAASGIVLTVGAAGILVLWARSQWETHEANFDLRLAITLTLGTLISPHLNRHDIIILLLPIVLFYNHLCRTGQRSRAVAGFLLTWPALFLLDEFALRDRLIIRLPVILAVILLIWIGYHYRFIKESTPLKAG